MNIQTNVSRRAFTLIELLVVVAVVAVLAGIFLPQLLLPHQMDAARAKRAACQNNLKQIGLAFRTWDGDYSNLYPMSVPTNEGGTMEFGGAQMFRHFQVMSNEINNTHLLFCPADTRTAADDFATLNNTNVSYFIGLDADETLPATILTGDRNLLTNGVPVGAGLAVINPNLPLTWSTGIHHLAGNVGLADGSVQQADNTYLRRLFQQTAANTNTTRLAMP